MARSLSLIWLLLKNVKPVRKIISFYFDLFPYLFWHIFWCASFVSGFFSTSFFFFFPVWLGQFQLSVTVLAWEGGGGGCAWRVWLILSICRRENCPLWTWGLFPSFWEDRTPSTQQWLHKFTWNSQTTHIYCFFCFFKHSTKMGWNELLTHLKSVSHQSNDYFFQCKCLSAIFSVFSSGFVFGVSSSDFKFSTSASIKSCQAPIAACFIVWF